MLSDVLLMEINHSLSIELIFVSESSYLTTFHENKNHHF